MALFHVAFGLFLYLTLALQQDVAAALRASAYAAAVSWPLLYLAAHRGDRRSYAVALIYFALGLSFPGLTLLLGAAFGVSALHALAGYVVALYTAALVRAFSSRRITRADATRAPRPLAPRRSIAVALVLCVVGVAPTMLYAIYMGRGEYPSVFFNADNPYHLSHVWSLLQEPGYPVMSLGVYGERRVYQYGGQAAAAALSLVSGLHPHTSYLGVIFPIYKVAAVSGAWCFATRLYPSVPLWMSAGTLAVVSRFPIDTRELTAAWDVFTRQFSASNSLNLFDIDHVLTQFGMFSALVVLAHAADEDRTRTLRFPALASLALLPVFKMSFFLGLGAAFGAWSLVVAWRTRSMRPVMRGAVTLALALVIVRILGLGAGETAGTLVISPFAHARDLLSPVARKVAGALGERTTGEVIRGLRQTATEYAQGFHWLLLGAAGVLLTRWPRSGRALEWAALVAAPLAFTNTFKYVRGPLDNESIRSSIDTTFTLVPYLVLAGALAIMSTATTMSDVRRRLIRGLFAVYAGYFVAMDVSALVTLSVVPAAGYERADNTAIAEALRSIPPQHSLVATNDTRYPATNFAARDFQMQIPAIFGHHAYFVDAVNDRFETSESRRVTQERLRAATWSDELHAIAKREGWTHFLVRRDAPHPAHPPLKLIFENGDYAVYRF